MIHPNLLRQVQLIVLGPLQFGLHMSELNALLPYLPCDASRDDCITGLVDGASASSAFAAGGLLGSLLGGTGADKLGRKRTLQYVAAVFLLGSLVSANCHDNNTLVFGRFVSGLAAGTSIVVAPMFISEISPDEHRGLLGACTQISVNTGIMLIQLCGLAWAEHNWRRVLWMGPFCALIQLIALTFAVESPKWLLSKGRTREARTTTEWLGRDFSEVRTDSQQQELEQGSETSITEYLTKKRYRRSLIVASGIMTLQQFSGINAIIFYGVSILKKVTPKYSDSINLGLSLLNLVVTAVSARMIDSFGNKPLLLSSLTGMASGTFLLALSLIFENSIGSALAAIFIIISFGMGLGPIPFLIIGEQTPEDALGIAQSFGTTCNWIATFIIGAFFPATERAIGPFVWFLFSGFCVLAQLWVGMYL